MKPSKKTILILVLWIVFNCIMAIWLNKAYSQERVRLAVLQDVKLATVGDKDHNYDAFTADVLIRLKMAGNQQKYGYLTIFPQFEYAGLETPYTRYSANVGYTLNQFRFVELMPYIGYGISNHDGSYKSISFCGELAIPIGRFNIVIDGEYLKRKELDKWLFSGYAGVEYKF